MLKNIIRNIILILLSIFLVTCFTINTVTINNIETGETGHLISIQILRAKYRLLLWKWCVIMRIRKIKSGVLQKLKNIQVNGKKEITANIFNKNNYMFRVNIIEDENIIIIYKEDTKSEKFETEIFEIV